MAIPILAMVTVIIIWLLYFINRSGKLAEFREELKPGNTVYYYDRVDNKYYEVTLEKMYCINRECINWGIIVPYPDGDSYIITSELNIFDKKYWL